MNKIIRNIPDGLDASYEDFPDVFDINGIFAAKAFAYTAGIKGITFIGDSITAGTYGSKENSWAERLNFAFMHRFKTKNVGFRSIQQSEVTSVHDVVKVGSWSEDIDGDSVTSVVFTSSTVNDTLEITPNYPTYAIRVGYVLADGESCSFEIIQGGKTLLTVDETSTTTHNRFTDYAYVKYNTETFSIKVLSGVVKITGIYYIDSGSQPSSLVFAKGGRSFNSTSPKAIDEMLSLSSGPIILALGYNDQFTTDSTTQQRDLSKIDQIASRAILEKRPLLILGFIWNQPETHFIKQKYNELGKERYIKYIDFSKQLVPGEVQTEDNFRINNLHLFRDAAHPNDDGYNWIFNVIKKQLGLEDAESNRKELMYGAYVNDITGTGGVTLYGDSVKTATLSKVGNATGRLVMTFPSYKNTLPTFFLSFVLDIWTYPLTMVGSITMFCHFSGSEHKFLELREIISSVTGLDTLVIEQGSVAGGNLALSFGNNDNQVWGYPTVTMRNATLSFSHNKNLLAGIKFDIRTDFTASQ